MLIRHERPVRLGETKIWHPRTTEQWLSFAIRNAARIRSWFSSIHQNCAGHATGVPVFWIAQILCTCRFMSSRVRATSANSHDVNPFFERLSAAPPAAFMRDTFRYSVAAPPVRTESCVRAVPAWAASTTSTKGAMVCSKNKKPTSFPFSSRNWSYPYRGYTVHVAVIAPHSSLPNPERPH